MKRNALVTSLLCALALVVATGCRTASPKPAKPAYGGLMSPRGVVPPANREYQPSAARPSLAPATAGEPLPPAEDDFLVVPDTFDADGLEDGINRGGAVDSRARYIYLHGTNQEQLLGTPASHGCIRLANRDIAELFAIVRRRPFYVNIG